MATETKVLDGVLASSGLNNATVANLQAQDGNWATATANNTNTSVRASTPTPTGPPNSGANLQTVTVQTRKNTTNSGSPTGTISVGFNGTVVISGSSFSITAAPSSSQTNTLTFDFATLVAAGAASSGSDFEIWIDTISASGSPSVRNSADIGYIGWTVDYSVAGRTASAAINDGDDGVSSAGSLVLTATAASSP